MTEFLTRRELREAERKGLVITPPAPKEEPEVLAVQTAIEIPVVETPPKVVASEPPVFLSRREMREAERKGISPSPVAPISQPEPVVELPDVPVEDEALASKELELMVSAENAILDLPPTDFTGTNLFAEPSTQSIVLDVAPEAIALPIETGEIAVTGSIAVLSEPITGSVTSGLDGLELDNADRQDAVTGVISIVEPVSALDLINARVNVGVVPKSVLRKGWWRPWAIALGAIVMAVAAILATVTILNAIG